MKRTQPQKKVRGFTLLELLMVVIIIAILTTIALPQFIKVSERARAAKAISWLASVRSAELRYAALNPLNNYTNDGDEVDISMKIPTDWKNDTFSLSDAKAGNPPTGYATLERTAGTYAGTHIGVQFGSGNICGTFEAFDANIPVCVED